MLPFLFCFLAVWSHVTTFAQLKNTKLTETTRVCIWQSLIFLVLKCSEIDHPHIFFTESFGAHALLPEYAKLISAAMEIRD